MILYRQLELNLSAPTIDRLEQGFHYYLVSIDPGFDWGVVGTTRARVDYTAFPEALGDGQQVCLSFWAWGDHDEEAMANLNRVFLAIHQCVRLLSRDINQALLEPGLEPTR